MSQANQAVAPKENTRGRVLFASMIGTTVEFFDFYAYATASVLVPPEPRPCPPLCCEPPRERELEPERRVRRWRSPMWLISASTNPSRPRLRNAPS